jgi:hypothetical protein
MFDMIKIFIKSKSLCVCVNASVEHTPRRGKANVLAKTLRLEKMAEMRMGMKMTMVSLWGVSDVDACLWYQ